MLISRPDGALRVLNFHSVFHKMLDFAFYLYLLSTLWIVKSFEALSQNREETRMGTIFRIPGVKQKQVKKQNR